MENEELDSVDVTDTVTPPTPTTLPTNIDTNGYLTTVASVAAIIDITTHVLKACDGDGLELVSAKGTTMSSDDLHDTISSLVYRSINDSTISHEVIQGSIY